MLTFQKFSSETEGVRKLTKALCNASFDCENSEICSTLSPYFQLATRSFRPISPRKSKTELPFSWDQIKVVAKGGWLTLEGEVEWNYVRQRAEQAVRRVRGVKGVSNLIALKPKVAAFEVRRKIEDAFRRSAQLDASRITVEAHGSEVVLRGTVRSWAEREEAEHAAWAAPGVTKVDNRISIGI